jgi:hypothetical protein
MGGIAGYTLGRAEGAEGRERSLAPASWGIMRPDVRCMVMGFDFWGKRWEVEE